LIGLIGRLAVQKGWDLVADIMKRWVHDVDCQWVILGTGEPSYQDLLIALAREFPGRVSVRLEFSEGLAHLIEAGSDMFLMPSHYEPCGLNQLYSLKYGTVPIVRETGGLADTVVDLTSDNLAAGKANGFSFVDYHPSALEATLRRAISVYTQQPAVWRQLVDIGMRQDWSWANSARQYIDLYHKLMASRNAAHARVQGLR
jgi:starch synthase